MLMVKNTPARRMWIAAAAAMCTVVLGGAEWVTWRASRTAVPPGATDPRRIVAGETVLVLGCPLAALHQWRVRIALRSTDPASARFVFCGGSVRTAVPEAHLMAEYAIRQRHLPKRNVVIQDRSTSTVENIANAAPLIADSPAVKIASDPLHALRARVILHDTAPDLGRRLVRARDYIPFEWGLVHAVMLGYDAYRFVRLRWGGPRRG